MSTSDQPPKLPLWPFLLIDAALLFFAWVISALATNKFAPGPLLGIVACVVGAAVAFACPFIVNYARAQDAALDERQRALDALARTVTTSAEQISVATNGLNEIAELTQKALRHADHLPQKLQEKVAELQAQLTSANDVEKEELEKEVAELRAGESERLQSTAEKIAKSSAEWAKLESATQKHLSAATAAFATAQTQAAATIDEKLAAALAALDTKLAALAAAAKKLSELPTPVTASSVVIEGGPATITSTPATAEAASGAAEPPAVAAEAPAKSDGPTHPPKRPRKPRRTEVAPDEAPPADATATPAVEPAQEAKPTEQKPEEPPPVIAEKIPEVAPAAPHTAEPFKTENGEQKTEEKEPKSDDSGEKSSPSSVLSSPSSASTPPSSEPAKAPRKRAPKKPEPVVVAEPSLGLDEPPPPPPAIEVAEPAISSDGATRLLVTAYIGIGNRLFIRGDGPGLSWEKGVPLQFVSIGKWRWETATATAPVKFKLYKNDDAECTALGAQSLAPGQQQEMTAAF